MSIPATEPISRSLLSAFPLLPITTEANFTKTSEANVEAKDNEGIHRHNKQPAKIAGNAALHRTEDFGHGTAHNQSHRDKQHNQHTCRPKNRSMNVEVLLLSHIPQD